MPGRDGTGPLETGPLTGGGFGRCLADEATGTDQSFVPGRGLGRGFRRRPCVATIPESRYGVAHAVNVRRMDEKAVLRERADILEKQLKQVKEQLKDID